MYGIIGFKVETFEQSIWLPFLLWRMVSMLQWTYNGIVLADD